MFSFNGLKQGNIDWAISLNIVRQESSYKIDIQKVF